MLKEELLPDGADLPKSYYEAKKIIQDLGLSYNKIDACTNDCMLYWKEDVLLDSCKPRLQRLFMSTKTSTLMTWHKDKRVDDGIMRHPADSMAWKSFDELHPSFASEPRNVRLGLASDGFQPFRNSKTSYRIWPVVLIPYNLPPWLCMKQENFILSMLIPGPNSPGDAIDIYLQPLIEELKELWEVGIETFDASSKQNFKLHASLLWTINDFPAYENLSGWSTKGNHKWRNDKDSFDGTKEKRLPPKMQSGIEILNQVQDLEGIQIDDLKQIEAQIPIMLCKLEKVFPPSFFDVMVHLPIHLASEAKIAGPIHYRCMYPVERWLYFLKSLIGNRTSPEGSIAEGYIANECMTLCSRYLHTIDTKFNRPERNYEGGLKKSNGGLSMFYQPGSTMGAKEQCNLEENELEQAHIYILKNCDEVIPYLEGFAQTHVDTVQHLSDAEWNR
ncbi:PREDICTED: uncharacterized protein LOC109238508 [Nicotiana attenuata]|uniref:uncharacterized protein LOC109238508 n=1 Tax=Nicotiana attenuata TaxID=49451 RepID=UPI00090579A6|nr:PREDICTED: uncharacterized protein LOC109238508 [Nicotiana attenuata]